MQHNDELVEAVAQVIALWDYRTNTGEDPEEDEDIVLPPHLEAASDVIATIDAYNQKD